MAKRKKAITTKRVQDTENQAAPQIPDVDVKAEIDEDPWGDDGLTVRQRAFVEALMGPAGGNATKAAEIAGYASDNRNALRVTSCRLLTYPNVQQAIAHARARKLDSPEWVRNSLLELASSSLANFIEVQADGTTVLNFDKAAEAGAIGQIREYVEESIKIDGSPASILKRKIKVHDRRAALETLAKLDGKLIERHEHSVTVDLTKLNDDDLHSLRELLTKANGTPAELSRN